MKKIAFILSMVLFFACQKKSDNTKETNSTKVEETQNVSTEAKLEEFVFRTDKGVSKIIAKFDTNTFKPDVLKYLEMGASEPVDLKILGESTDPLKPDRYIVENPKTNEKFEISKDFAMVATLYKGDEPINYNRETFCYSDDNQVISTSAGPVFLPIFYSEKSENDLKEVKIYDPVGGEHHPKCPECTYFKGTLPNGKKVDILAHPYSETETKCKITFIVDGKETIFKEK